MKLLSVLAIAALLSFTLAAADLAGAWKGSMDTQMGAMPITITFQPGAALTGKVEAGDYSGPIENASRDGDKISFASNIGPGTLTFEGTLSGDELKLNVIGTQGDKYQLVCKRQK